MSEQQSNNNRNNQQRRHHHKRRHHNHNKANQPGQAGQPSSSGPQSGGANQQHRKRFHRPHHQNRPRPQHGSTNPPFNIDKIYEKYLNLLDQHLIARRKYHDLFFRADPAQKTKLEKNFFNTLNDVRDFEAKLAPDVKVLFEKRNNGLEQDKIYSSNHNLENEVVELPSEEHWEDPHFLQSQKMADYSNDTEESVGSLDDYLKYKNLQ